MARFQRSNNNYTIEGVSDPVNNTDAANRQYVDGRAVVTSVDVDNAGFSAEFEGGELTLFDNRYDLHVGSVISFELNQGTGDNLVTRELTGNIQTGLHVVQQANFTYDNTSGVFTITFPSASIASDFEVNDFLIVKGSGEASNLIGQVSDVTGAVVTALADYYVSDIQEQLLSPTEHVAVFDSFLNSEAYQVAELSDISGGVTFDPIAGNVVDAQVQGSRLRFRNGSGTNPVQIDTESIILTPSTAATDVSIQAEVPGANPFIHYDVSEDQWALDHTGGSSDGSRIAIESDFALNDDDEVETILVDGVARSIAGTGGGGQSVVITAPEIPASFTNSGLTFLSNTVLQNGTYSVSGGNAFTLIGTTAVNGRVVVSGTTVTFNVVAASATTVTISNTSDATFSAPAGTAIQTAAAGTPAEDVTVTRITENGAIANIDRDTGEITFTETGAAPAIVNNGGEPELGTGITADEVRGLLEIHNTSYLSQLSDVNLPSDFSDAADAALLDIFQNRTTAAGNIVNWYWYERDNHGLVTFQNTTADEATTLEGVNIGEHFQLTFVDPDGNVADTTVEFVLTNNARSSSTLTRWSFTIQDDTTGLQMFSQQTAVDMSIGRWTVTPTAAMNIAAVHVGTPENTQGDVLTWNDVDRRWEAGLGAAITNDGGTTALATGVNAQSVRSLIGAEGILSDAQNAVINANPFTNDRITELEGKANRDLQNIDDDLTTAEQATVRSRIGAVNVHHEHVTSTFQGGLPLGGDIEHGAFTNATTLTFTLQNDVETVYALRNFFIPFQTGLAPVGGGADDVSVITSVTRGTGANINVLTVEVEPGLTAPASGDDAAITLWHVEDTPISVIGGAGAVFDPDSRTVTIADGRTLVDGVNEQYSLPTDITIAIAAGADWVTDDGTDTSMFTPYVFPRTARTWRFEFPTVTNRNRFIQRLPVGTSGFVVAPANTPDDEIEDAALFQPSIIQSYNTNTGDRRNRTLDVTFENNLTLTENPNLDDSAIDLYTITESREQLRILNRGDGIELSDPGEAGDVTISVRDTHTFVSKMNIFLGTPGPRVTNDTLESSGTFSEVTTLTVPHSVFDIDTTAIFSVASTEGLTVGRRVRIVNTATVFMDATITAVGTNSITVGDLEKTGATVINFNTGDSVQTRGELFTGLRRDQFTVGVEVWYFWPGVRFGAGDVIETDDTNGALGLFSDREDPHLATATTFNLIG